MTVAALGSMAKPQDGLWAVCACTALVLSSGIGKVYAVDLQEEVKWLREQNKLLQEAMRQQQAVIKDLTKKVDRLDGSSSEETEAAKKETGFGLNKVMISGEGGVGFFK